MKDMTEESQDTEVVTHSCIFYLVYPSLKCLSSQVRPAYHKLTLRNVTQEMPPYSYASADR